MRKHFLSVLNLEELQDLRWTVYWEGGAMVNKLWFNWAIKQGIIKRMFDLLQEGDSFNRWDVEKEITNRGGNRPS
jgi:hypothetical protein